jgi:hypothetical protein
MIVQQAPMEGSGKGTTGWFPVQQANVSYDHPFHAAMDHALNIDFVNEAGRNHYGRAGRSRSWRVAG